MIPIGSLSMMCLYAINLVCLLAIVTLKTDIVKYACDILKSQNLTLFLFQGTWTKEVMFSRADWLIGNGKMQSQSPLAPSKDHRYYSFRAVLFIFCNSLSQISLGKDYGSFLYAESTSTFKNTPKLTSDVFPPTSPRGRCDLSSSV